MALGAHTPLFLPRINPVEDVPWLRWLLSPEGTVLATVLLLAGTIVLTGLSAIAPFYLYARKGWDGTEIVAFGLFMVLITAISCWFVSGLMGLFVMMRGKDQQDLAFSPHPATPRTRTAWR